MRVPTLRRRHLAALVVASMVLFAGCSGVADSGGPTNSTETTATTATTTTATSTQTTTATTEGSGSDDDSTDGNAANADTTGTMTVLVGGSQVSLSGDDGPVTFRDGDRKWFTSQSDVTLADALAAQGVEVTDTTLTYDGTTYTEGENGATVEVRVDGQSVDPTQYTLEDGDSVWVYVNDDSLQITPPGDYIKEARDHQHGAIEVVVDGETVNLSQAQYQHQNDHFHLEGGDGAHWHAHTYSATYEWSMATLGIEIDGETVTFDGTTYDPAEGDTVKVLVNGEPVEEPGDYRLKDGDSVRIVLDTAE